ncbi:MAG: hypothetical protein EAX90_11900 [Candidatus Heimdallarchaeota archaeon]|nr:hypothetical protein [Candidatus Heimdallarchaeota archaeon]
MSSKEKTKNEVLTLINQQKKAKINWIASIVQISEDNVRSIAKDLGLIIEGDFVIAAAESAKIERADNVENQLINEIISVRTNKFSAILNEEIEIKTRIIVYVFSGDFRYYAGQEAQKYVQNIRNRFQNYSIPELLPYIQLSNVFKIIEQPKLISKLDKNELAKLHSKINIFDEYVKFLGRKLAQESIVSEKKGKNKIYTILMPDERMKFFNENEIEHIMSSLQLYYIIEIRKGYYKLLNEGLIKKIQDIDLDNKNEKDIQSRILINNGNENIINGFYKIAGQYYKHNLDYSNDEFEALLYYSKALIYQKEIDSANLILERALKIRTNDAILQGLLALKEIYANDVTQAEEYLEKANEINAKEPFLFFVKGLLLKSKNEYQEALKSFELAYKESNNLVEAINEMVDIYSILDQKQKSIDLIQKVSKTHKNNPALILKLGAIYEENKMDKEANELYNSIVSVYSRLPKAMELLGYNQLKLNKIDDAINTFSKRLSDNMEDFIALHGLSLAYKSKMNYEKALDYELMALKEKSDFIEGLENISEIYSKLNQNQKAKDALEKIEKITKKKK